MAFGVHGSEFRPDHGFPSLLADFPLSHCNTLIDGLIRVW